MDVEQHYQAIAQVAAANAPVEWSRIEVAAEVGDDHASYRYIAFDRSDGRHSYAVADYDEDDRVSEALFSLRGAMTQPGQEPWSRAVFTMTPDGKFSFDVEYAD